LHPNVFAILDRPAGPRQFPSALFGEAALRKALTPNPSPNTGRGEPVGALTECAVFERDRPISLNEQMNSPLPALGEGLGVRAALGGESVTKVLASSNRTPTPVRRRRETGGEPSFLRRDDETGRVR
jgi:hypothetical protein